MEVESEHTMGLDQVVTRTLKSNGSNGTVLLATADEQVEKSSSISIDNRPEQLVAFSTRSATTAALCSTNHFGLQFSHTGRAVNMHEEGKSQRRPRRTEAAAPPMNAAKHGAPNNSAANAPPVSPVTPASPQPAELLTAEQEKLMIENLPIVRFIARRIHERLPQHVPIEDLYSAGVVGLLDAFSKFDPAKQVQFRSYAQFRIRGAILDNLRTLDWSPRELRRKGRAIEQAIQTLTAQYGRAPHDLEIAAQLHIDLAAYQQLLGELKGLEIGTLHSERSEDSGEEELVYLPNRPEDDPLFRFLHSELRERLTEAISDLPERERLVMTLYYYEETTMKEIGLILGVVESRISQIHASAVLHLRARLADFAMRKESPNSSPAAHRNSVRKNDC
jgi:RNA polymerase sigma factor for flagellar operon FliA